MNNSIKIGDTVRVSKDAPTIYNKGWLHDWCNTDSVVKEPTFIDRLKKAQAEQEELLKRHNKR